MAGLAERVLLTACMLALCVSSNGCGRDRGTIAPIRVAVAADLTRAFQELGRMYEKDTGERVSFSFGSSGLLAKQLEQGAPFDLFAAASVAYVDEVIAAGACDGSTKAALARGRVAIWARVQLGRGAPESIAELTDPRFTRIAMANPEHAPYGKAAKEALGTAGIWEQVRPRIVYGENVRQALEFAESGNVDAALVALALVIGKPEGSWTLLEERLHRPIDQALVACRRGARFEGGRAFASFINSVRGRQVMRRYGFELPGEALSE